MLAIEGGPVSQLEAATMQVLKGHLQRDMEQKGLCVNVKTEVMNYDAFMAAWASETEKRAPCGKARATDETLGPSGRTSVLK